MSSLTEYKFRTKTGFCIINAERIILKREGIDGQIADRVYGHSISHALSIYSVTGIAAIAVGIWLLLDKNYFTGGFCCVVGVLFILNVIASRNNSAANIIERSTVISVKAHPPHPPFTRPYFIVNFLEDGKKRRRIIYLPGVMFGEKEEYRLASELMSKAGWNENPNSPPR
jgi:hypothetical protein